jgi:mannose-6-phosphate isomerase-like protein (cupin superfamily)
VPSPLCFEENKMITPSFQHVSYPPTYLFLCVQMKVLLSAAQTGGQFTLIESIMPPGGDGGLHVHANDDESMHMLEGELDVTIGETSFTLKPGETYLAPRGMPHRLRNLGSVPARSLLITTPGGFDEMISQAGFALDEGAVPGPAVPPTPEQIGRLLAVAAKFGISVLAPPEPPQA